MSRPAWLLPPGLEPCHLQRESDSAQQRAEQQKSLDLISKASKELIANSSLFDKQGKKLPEDQLAKQAGARKRAIQTLAEQGVGESQILELTFKTDAALNKLQSDLNSVESKFRLEDSPFKSAQNTISGPRN